MAKLNINSNRMELQRLRARLRTASRGHKLLKDKSEEMIRQFMASISSNKTLRSEIEAELTGALHAFIIAKSKMTGQETEELLSMPSVSCNFTAGLKNIMGLNVPDIKVTGFKQSDILPYGLLSGSAGLDKSIITLTALLPKIIQLAETEKICDMLAFDIEKNRRRINALEFILIPQIKETIRYIVMKLEENDRNNRIRLMKVKEIIEK